MTISVLLATFSFALSTASTAPAQGFDFSAVVPLTDGIQGANFIRPLDVDQDGDMDLVTSGPYANEVFWFENDGLGSFARVAPLVTLAAAPLASASCRDAALIDYTGSGITDLVVAENFSNRVLRFPRTGTSSFGAPQVLATSNGTLGEIEVLDVDGDGDEDLLVAGDFGPSGTWLFRNTGSGVTNPVLVGHGGRLIEPTDFEGDGDVDFLVASPGGQVALLRNTGGAANFSVTIVTSGFPDLDLAAGDLNADGIMDAVVTRRSQTIAEMFIANAAGQFSLQFNVVGLDGATPPVELMDLDGDLDLDIVLPRFGSTEPRYSWVENLGGTFDNTPRQLFPSEGLCEHLALADLDGDGAPDLVGAGDYSLVQVGLSAPTGIPTELETITGGWDVLKGALTLDADSDGDVDLAVYSLADGIGVAANDGTGAFSAPVNIGGYGSQFNRRTQSAHAADVDGDGRDDILTVTSTSRLLYFRQVPGGFTTPLDIGTAFEAAPRTVDVDRDGDLDVVGYRFQPSRLVWVEQTAPGVFATSADLQVLTTEPRSYEFIDMDLDGLMDLVTYEVFTLGGTNRMLVYYGLAAGGFEPGVDVPLPTFGGSPSGMQVFDDLDGDGLADFIYTRGQATGATAWWTRNLGARQFAPAEVISVVGESIRRIELGQPVLGGPKGLAVTTRTNTGFERYQVFEVTPANTLGAVHEVDVLGVSAGDFFFADLGTGAQDLVMVDVLTDRVGVSYNEAWRDVGTSYCGPAVPNSAGLSGEITAFGSRVVAVNALDLVATQLPAGATTFFLASLNAGFVANPGGSSGNLCLGAPIGRISQPGFVGAANDAGVFRRTIDLTMLPQPAGPVNVMPQSTWHFQAWHRDGVPGQPPTSNFTDGIEVTFD